MPNRFVLGAVDKSNVTDNQLQRSDGLSIRFTWAEFEPQQGDFDFNFVLSQIARCVDAGKPFMLRMLCGIHSPDWVYDHVQSYHWIEEEDDGDVERRMPLPWDAELRRLLQDTYGNMAACLACHPMLHMVHVSGVSKKSAEFHEPPGLREVPGYSNKTMADAWVKLTNLICNHFPNAMVALNTPKYEYGPTVINRTTKNHPTQMAAQHNSLKATTDPQQTHHQNVIYAGTQGALVGFQMVCPSANQARFGGPFEDAIAIGDEAPAEYYEVYRGDL